MVGLRSCPSTRSRGDSRGLAKWRRWPPGEKPQGGETERVGREEGGGMCIVCDFNLVLGRQGGQGGHPSGFLLLLHPTPLMGSGISWCPSLPPFHLPGLRASCPKRALFAHRPYRTIWGRGEKRTLPIGGGQRVRLACSKGLTRLWETLMTLPKGEFGKPHDFPKSCFFFS